MVWERQQPGIASVMAELEGPHGFSSPIQPQSKSTALVEKHSRRILLEEVRQNFQQEETRLSRPDEQR